MRYFSNLPTEGLLPHVFRGIGTRGISTCMTLLSWLWGECIDVVIWHDCFVMICNCLHNQFVMFMTKWMGLIREGRPCSAVSCVGAGGAINSLNALTVVRLNYKQADWFLSLTSKLSSSSTGSAGFRTFRLVAWWVRWGLDFLSSFEGLQSRINSNLNCLTPSGRCGSLWVLVGVLGLMGWWVSWLGLETRKGRCKLLVNRVTGNLQVTDKGRTSDWKLQCWEGFWKPETLQNQRFDVIMRTNCLEAGCLDNACLEAWLILILSCCLLACLEAWLTEILYLVCYAQVWLKFTQIWGSTNVIATI
jgi:hypothetical protein